MWRSAAAVVLIFACLPARPASSLQGQYPVPGWFIPDGLDHWYCFNSSVPAGNARTIRSSRMSYLDDATDFYDKYAGTCGTSTDVVFFESVPTSGARGWIDCVSSTAYVCDQFWVNQAPAVIFLNTGSHYSEWNDDAIMNYNFNYRKTICHEVAHSIGLDADEITYLTSHPAFTDCTVSGWVPSDFAYVRYSLGNRFLVDHAW